MANDDQIAARGGMLPVQFPYGNFRRTLYRLTTSAAAGVFLGQPMDLDSNGRAVTANPGDNNVILGPVVGFVDTNKAGLPAAFHSLSQGPSLPANTDAFVVIADDPDQLFQIQEDTGGSALTESNIGNHATYVFRTSSGNTTTGYSTAELDRSDAAADTGGALQVVGLVDLMNQDGTSNDFGNYAKLLVRIAHHRLAGGGPINTSV